MCKFSIAFVGDAEALVSRAKQEIERAGGSLNGNAGGGSFMGTTPIGSIAGYYQIIGRDIIIEISKKPFLLSCKKIERELREVMI